jgi:hypothetical protein
MIKEGCEEDDSCQTLNPIFWGKIATGFNQNVTGNMLAYLAIKR